MEKITSIDHVKNEEILIRVKEERNMLHKGGRLTGLVTSGIEMAF